MSRYRSLSRFSLVLLAAIGPAAPVFAVGMSGPLAQAVAQGHQIFLHDTFNGKGRTCNSCHTAGGRGPTVLPWSQQTGPSLSNAAAVFPRYKSDEGRVMTLEDEIHGCIRGALRGQAPAYDSPTMVALTAYVTSLAQGKPIEMGGAYR